MNGLTNVIQICYTDKEINNLIKELPEHEIYYTTHFSHNENLFIRFKTDFIVPHFPIHHDVRNEKPSNQYLKIMKELLNTLIERAPGIFSGLVYFFNPAEIFKPGFFKIYKIKKKEFLYLLQLDLLYNPQFAEISERGDNDVTPVYRTKELFLQAYLFPLEKVELINDKIRAFIVKQTISETWIGEQGRGYLLKGIWIDDELTKFFSKLFLPPGKRMYPYYPFLCMYKTFCANIVGFNSIQREEFLPLFYKASQFIYPYMKRIEKALKHGEFSESLPLFQEIQALHPLQLDGVLNKMRITAYLNQNDMKEFKIEQDT